MSPLRTLMRQHTTAAHELLEGTPLMRAFATGAPSAAEYRDYLIRQLQLHEPLEAALAKWVPPEWNPLRLVKAGWLLGDLLALGAAANQRHAEIPAVSSIAEALGMLYVIEGGTLGLQAVRKRFGRHHPALNAAGRFLSGYGPDTGRHWIAFIARLETLPAPAWPQAIDAAGRTFAAFHRHFQEPMHG